MNWAEKVERLATRASRSYRQLESRAGWAENTLKTAMRRGAAVNIIKALGLASALSVDPAWLFDDSRGWEDPQPQSTESNAISAALRTVYLVAGAAAVSCRGPEDERAIMTVLQNAGRRLRKNPDAGADFAKRTIDGLEAAIDYLSELGPEPAPTNSINIPMLVRALDTGTLNVRDPKPLTCDESPDVLVIPGETEAQSKTVYGETIPVDASKLIRLDAHTPVAVEVLQAPVVWNGVTYTKGQRFDIAYFRIQSAMRHGEVMIASAEEFELKSMTPVHVKVRIPGYLWNGPNPHSPGDRIRADWYQMKPAITSGQVQLCAIVRE